MSFDELKAKGNEAFQGSRFQEAIEWYSKAIDIDPSAEISAVVYSNRAACWQQLDNLPKALEDSECCIRAKPSWVKGYFRKGLALEKMKEYDDALKCFQQALKVDEGNTQVQEKLIDLNNLLRERNQKATPMSCKTAAEAKIIGNSLYESGKYEIAAQFYERAIKLCSDKKSKEMANYYANRASCFQQTHSFHEVISDCNEALAIDPTHLKALLRRATAYEALEKWQKALDDYGQVNRLSPGLPLVSQGVLRSQRALKG